MGKFNYIELFAGIGGFRQALDDLGGECVFASEIDKFAKQSYTALYGDVHLHDDITKIEASDIPNHDVIVAGIPCQAFSVAGKRKGFEDARGTLFFDVVRIAKERRPKAVWIENVKGLVNHDKGRTLNVMIETLCEIGYTVDFTILNSKYFGVPQNRERIFIVAVRDDLVSPEPWVIEGTTIVPRGKQRIQALEGVKTFNFDWPEEGEVTTRLRDVLEAQVDEKYYLSDDKTAKLVAQLGEKDKVVGTVGHHPFSKKLEFKGYNDDISPCLIATDYKAPKTTLESSPNLLGLCDIKGNDAIRRVYADDGVSPTLTTMQGGYQEPKIAVEQDGIPIREATKQGYAMAAVGDAVNFQFPESKTRRGRVGKQIANTLEASSINQGVVEAEEVRPVLTPDRIEKRQNGRRFKEDGEESFTLTAQDKHGIAIGQSPKYRIRKLTPLECWRLQGFSDEAHQTVVGAGLSDSQRYKQAGNAVTVNVITAIGERLLPYL